MKGSKVKRISCIIAIMLLVALVTACGVPERGNNETPTPTVSGEAPETPEVNEPVTITYMTLEHANWPIRQDVPVLKEIEKQIGVKVEFIPLSGDSATQKINTVFASGDMPDVMNLSISLINQHGERAFVGLNDYIENSMPSIKKLADDGYKKELTNLDGEIYGIPLYGRNQLRRGIVLRGDLLEKYNLEKPTTTTELENVLRVFKDNDPDCIPFGTQTNFHGNLLPVLQLAYGMHFDIKTDIDGKLILNATMENYRELISWVSKLYADDLLDQEYIVRSQASWEETVGIGKMAGFTGFYTRADQFNDSSLQDSDAYLTGIVPLEGPFGDRGANSYAIINSGYCAAITKDCQDVDAAIKYIDFLFSDEGRILTSWGIEGEHHIIKENGEREFTDDYKDALTDYAVQANIGINQQVFPRYYDAQFQMAAAGPQTKEAMSLTEGLHVAPLPPLNHTEEKLQEMSEIWATLGTYIEEYTHNVITGKDSISSWDTFQENIKRYNGERYMELLNESYAQYLAK